MKGIETILEKEQKNLEKEIFALKQNLENAPAGSLRISHSNGCVQYYCRESGDFSERPKPKYIRKEDYSLAEQLAQRDYDRKLLKQLEARLKMIKQARKVYSNTDPVQIYEQTCMERKKLITPRYISDEEYARQWQQTEYVGKQFAQGTAEIYTNKGERVRSKSEKIIADALERYGIPYRYECPLEFQGERTIYPDFTVLNKRTRKVYFLEHLGMMDDPEYVGKAMKKIEDMECHGIFPGKNLLITSETGTSPINMIIVDMIIREYLI